MNTDFLIEKYIYDLNEDYAKTLRETFFVAKPMLTKYINNFSNYNDHSITHSMRDIENANKLIGKNYKNLNAEEIYIFLIAIFFHDTGMGIDDKFYYMYYKDVLGNAILKDYKNLNHFQLIRKFHNEFSAKLLLLCQPYIEGLSIEHAEAAAILCKTHRNHDLRDRKLLPTDYKLNDAEVNLAYLAALLRLCDELDLTNERVRNINRKLCYSKDRNDYLRALNYFDKIENVDDKIVVYFTNIPKNNVGFDSFVDTVKKEFEECTQIMKNAGDYCVPNKLIFKESDIK